MMHGTPTFVVFPGGKGARGMLFDGIFKLMCRSYKMAHTILYPNFYAQDMLTPTIAKHLCLKC